LYRYITADERIAVCFAAAAATAAAAAAMIGWSAVAGELDEFTARRASVGGCLYTS
jgi:hypothetical protein